MYYSNGGESWRRVCHRQSKQFYEFELKYLDNHDPDTQAQGCQSISPGLDRAILSFPYTQKKTQHVPYDLTSSICSYFFPLSRD